MGPTAQKRTIKHRAEGKGGRGAHWREERGKAERVTAAEVEGEERSGGGTRDKSARRTLPQPLRAHFIVAAMEFSRKWAGK